MNFADQVYGNVQHSYVEQENGLKNSAPVHYQEIDYTSITREEDSESCSCISCNCELCVAEQQSLHLDNSFSYSRSNFYRKVSVQLSSQDLTGNNGYLM